MGDQLARNLNRYSMTVSWSDEDNCWVARSPEWPNLSAFGESRQEAINEAEIALDALIAVSIEKGFRLPSERNLET